jgi:hypothetical protein
MIKTGVMHLGVAPVFLELLSWMIYYEKLGVYLSKNSH